MKRLNLKIERLGELSADELKAAVGGVQYTGGTCAFSLADPCVSVAPGCTALCHTHLGA